MTCPTCGGPALRHGAFVFCGVHGDITALVAAPAGGVAANPPASDLEHVVLERFPFPVAYGYHRVIQAENAAVARDNLIYTWAAAIRFTTLVFLSEFLQSERQNPAIARVVRRLQLPSLGDWHQAFRTLALHLHPAPALGEPQNTFAGGGPFSQDLLDAARVVVALRVDGLPLFDAMAHFRNARLGHGATTSEAELQAQLEAPRQWLTTLLEHLRPLAELTPLRRVGDGDVVRLVGASRTFTAHPVTDPRLDALLQDSAVALSGPGGALMPLLRVAEWARETTLARVDLLRGTKYFPATYQERRASSAERRGVDDVVVDWLARGREAALILAAEAGAGKTSLLCHLCEHLLVPDGPATAASPGPDVTRDAVVLVLGETLRGASDGRLFRRVRDGLGFTDVGAETIGSMAELLAARRQVGRHEDPSHETRRLVLFLDAVNEAEEPKALLEEVAELAAAAAAVNREEGRPFVRLLVTLRSERMRALLDRWAERSDTPLLPHAECFAHFADERGRAAPYLELRLFTAEEAERAWPRAVEAALPACPAGWSALAPPRRELVRHPLRTYLFHTAFAGVVQPPTVRVDAALWDAWPTRTFDPTRSSGRLEQEALDLADACVGRGAGDIPLDLAAERLGGLRT